MQLFNVVPLITLLLCQPLHASICRNLTRTSWSTDSYRQFATTDTYTLERVICPRNTTANPTPCPVPRGVYNLTISRILNVSVSAEDEDAIFEAARLGYWNRNQVNVSLWDKAWDDKMRTVDTRGNEWSDIFFRARENLNYTLNFVAYMRSGSATLGGCDNETLNGMSVQLRAPYLENNTIAPERTQVAGTLIGGGPNVTETNSAAGSAINSAGAMAMAGLGTAFILFL